MTYQQQFDSIVNEFQTKCNELFKAETQIDISVNNVPFKWLAEFSKENGNDIKQSTICSSSISTLKVNDSRETDVRISTFKI